MDNSSNVSQQILNLLHDETGLYEQIEQTHTAWQGSIFSAQIMDVKLADGSQSRRELIRHPGGCGVCVVRDGNMCVVRQYRVSVGRITLEIPAGRLNPHEEPKDCAARELWEETGIRAHSLELLACAAGSIGFTDEMTHIYFASELSFEDAHPDENERVKVAWVPVRDIADAAEAGIIRDAKTIIAAYAVLARGLA